MGTALVFIILLAVVGAALFSMAKDKKAGKSCCGSCAGCAGCKKL